MTLTWIASNVCQLVDTAGPSSAPSCGNPRNTETLGLDLGLTTPSPTDTVSQLDCLPLHSLCCGLPVLDPSASVPRAGGHSPALWGERLPTRALVAEKPVSPNPAIASGARESLGEGFLLSLATNIYELFSNKQETVVPQSGLCVPCREPQSFEPEGRNWLSLQVWPAEPRSKRL